MFDTASSLDTIRNLPLSFHQAYTSLSSFPNILKKLVYKTIEIVLYTRISNYFNPLFLRCCVFRRALYLTSLFFHHAQIEAKKANPKVTASSTSSSLNCIGLLPFITRYWFNQAINRTTVRTIIIFSNGAECCLFVKLGPPNVMIVVYATLIICNVYLS